MRSPKSRSRNRQNRQRSLGNVVNRVFDSSGPEGKVRGTPQQIIDKYLTLARDAQLSSDRVAEQSFLQHAEHYTRMLSDAQREMAERQQQQQQQQGGQRGEGGDDDRRDQRRRDPRDGRGDQRAEDRSDDADANLPPARDTAEPAAEAEDLPGESRTAADATAQPDAEAAAKTEAEAEAKPKPKPRRSTRTTTPRPRARKPVENPAPDEVASGD